MSTIVQIQVNVDDARALSALTNIETEEHIKQLRQDGEQQVRYTAMMPDVPFMVLGLSCDIGWIMHLTAGTIYLCRNGFRHVLDYMAFLTLAAVVAGVACIVYLGKIHEKEIATRRQKNFSFGLLAYSGLAGAVVGILQSVAYTSASSELVWIVTGGFLNFASALPIFLSFKKGIYYGVK